MTAHAAIPIPMQRGTPPRDIPVRMSQSLPAAPFQRMSSSPATPECPRHLDGRYYNQKLRFFSKLNLLEPAPVADPGDLRPPVITEEEPSCTVEEAAARSSKPPAMPSSTKPASKPPNKLQFDQSFSTNFDAFDSFTSSGISSPYPADDEFPSLSASAPASAAQPIAIPSDLHILDEFGTVEDCDLDMPEVGDDGELLEVDRDSSEFIPPHLLVNRSAFSLDVRLPERRMGKMAAQHDPRFR